MSGNGGKESGGHPGRPTKRSRSSTRTEKTKRRHERRKKRRGSLTKAQVRKSFRTDYLNAVRAIRRCNDSEELGLKFDALKEAAAALERCLRVQPGNRYIKLQWRICDGELKRIIKHRTMSIKSVPMVIDPHWLG